jgi:hypothetical protein
MNPTTIVAFVATALAFAGGFGTAWKLQAENIDALKLEAKDAIIVQQRYARAALERATSQIIAAQNAAQARNARNAADSSRAADAGSGLRIASADTVRAATADTDACGAVVAAYGVVVDESIAVIREMATGFDQCLSDNQALMDAWPKFDSTKSAPVK